MIILNRVFDFEWDEGNSGKNLKKHGVTNQEAEEIFFDEKKKIYKDILHSQKEPRSILLGKTEKKRLLCVVFTIRRGKLRVISARNINKKERYLYEKAV